MADPDQFDARRRTFLKGAAAMSMSALGAAAANSQNARAQNAPAPATDKSPANSPKAPKRDSQLITRENAKDGALDWQLTRVRVDKSKIRSPWIEGYCSRQSVEAGDKLDIMVSLNPPGKFNIEIFRMGYYGGRGARLMQTLGPLTGKTQPDPPTGRNRLRECRWQSAVQLTIPGDWPSGVYLGRLSRIASGKLDTPLQSFTVFIVRDHRPADILFQCSDNTWQAYNRWPDTFSLYDDGKNPWVLKSGIDISFDRPYGKYRQIYDNPQSVGSGEFLLWEYPLCYWLEQHGYDVSYCSNSDMLDPKRGLACKTFISLGHDEYWDVRQYDSVKTMIEKGISAFFLSGNAVCFVSPFRQASDKRPNRIITRAGTFGGMTDKERARMGPFATTGPDKRQLMGARTIIPFNGGGDWIVTKPDHWMFTGTGMKKGDRIPGLVGWEFHGDPAQIKGLEVVAEGTALTGGGEPAHWTATIYPGPTAGKNNFVFNASTIYWAQGLSSPPGHMLPWAHWTRPHGPDARVQRMTKNLLKRAIG